MQMPLATLNAKVAFPGSGRNGGLPSQYIQKFFNASDFKSRKVAYFSTF
jgi:hypothetical protein